MEAWIRRLETDLAEVSSRPVAEGTNELLRAELLAMTHHAQQLGEGAHGLRTQLPNPLTMAAWAAPVAPLTPEDSSQKCPQSLDVSWFDRTQLRRWIAQLRMVI